MKQTSNINFKKNYKVRPTIWKLIMRIVVFELALTLAHYGIATTVAKEIIFLMGGINIVVVVWLFIDWFNEYYIISPKGISKTKGVLFKKTRTFDISSIASVKVIQSIPGRLLNYGTIILENPLTKKDLWIRNIGQPYKQASIIEKQRLKELSEIPQKKVVTL